MKLKDFVEELQKCLTPETEEFVVKVHGECWCCDSWEIDRFFFNLKEEYVGIE